MDNNIQIFEHEEFGQVRTIEIDGKIYFVGLDVAKALGYKNPRDAVNKKVDEEDKLVINTYVLNIQNKKRGNPNLTVINESGYYSLVLARQINKKDNSDISQKIKRFKRWVTSEVIPTIRKTGTYSMNPPRIEEKSTHTILIEKVEKLNVYIDDKSHQTKTKRSRPKMYDLDELLELLVYYTDSIGSRRDKKSGKDMYTCPFCHSGEHGTGSTGAMHIGRGKDGKLLYYCHSCNSGGNIINMYCQYHGITQTKENFPQIINGIRQDLGLSTEDYQDFKKSYKFRNPVQNDDLNPQSKVDKKDYTNFFKLALQNQGKAIEYLRNVRKIEYAESIAQYFQLGFIPNYAYEWKDNQPYKTTSAIIIPTSQHSYAWRSTIENIKKKSGTVRPLNIEVLNDKSKKYLFLVEGEFDLFSILDITNDIPNCEFSAISVNSAGNLPRFLENQIKEKIQEGVTLIIALDNDKEPNPNVENFIQKGLNIAKKNKIPCVVADVKALYLNQKDSNEALKFNREGFKKSLINEVEKAKSLELISEDTQNKSNKFPNVTFENIDTPEILTYMYTLENKTDISEYVYLLEEKAKLFKKSGALHSVIMEHKKEAFKRLNELERQKKISNTPSWVAIDKNMNYFINEPMYCEVKSKELQCKTINGNIRTIDGLQIEDNALISDIQKEISQFVVRDIARQSQKLLNALKNHTFSVLPSYDGNIHLINGTYNVKSRTFDTEKKWCINRLATQYNPNALKPQKWLKYLDELLTPDNIKTLQEFCGYCLIPSTSAQVMLFLIGVGGEGKSIIGKVLNALMGTNNVYNEKIHELQENRFKLVNCENKLLLIDDDLNSKAIKDTGILKTLVTGGRQTLEPKGKPSYEAELYSRVLCFGNIPLVSLYDHSDGFYRRQIIIKTKPKPKDRNINHLLDKEIIGNELEGILLWCLEGLNRLIDNDYKIFISKDSLKALEDAKRDAFNFLEFLSDENEVEFNPNYSATSNDIYANYCRWCSDNAFDSLKKVTIMRYLSEHQDQYSIFQNKNVKDIDSQKYVRGYNGIRLLKHYRSSIISF